MICGFVWCLFFAVGGVGDGGGGSGSVCLCVYVVFVVTAAARGKWGTYIHGVAHYRIQLCTLI